jgi:hypothetical protein
MPAPETACNRAGILVVFGSQSTVRTGFFSHLYAPVLSVGMVFLRCIVERIFHVASAASQSVLSAVSRCRTRRRRPIRSIFFLIAWRKSSFRSISLIRKERERSLSGSAATRGYRGRKSRPTHSGAFSVFRLRLRRMMVYPACCFRNSRNFGIDMEREPPGSFFLPGLTSS